MNKFQKTLNAICKYYNITFTSLNPMEVNADLVWTCSNAIYELNCVTAPEPIGPMTEENFAAALHEIGHCIHYSLLSKEEIKKLDHASNIRNTQRKTSLAFVNSEAAAWNIAQSLAGKLWSPRMASIRATAMFSYIHVYNVQFPSKPIKKSPPS